MANIRKWHPAFPYEGIWVFFSIDLGEMKVSHEYVNNIFRFENIFSEVGIC